MEQQIDRKAVVGWMAFDWASQPYHTLLITFIFAPYFVSSVASDPVQGQVVWGYMIAGAGIVIALMAPVLGAMVDNSGPRKPWIAGFSVLYVAGAASLWFAVPSMADPTPILIAFALGLIGVEFAATFSNAMLPDLVPRRLIGRVSGYGWAVGYFGGLIALIFTMMALAESSSGLTLNGTPPIFGLDPEMYEGTRAVGPFTALWFLVFMVPFFLWVPDLAKRRDVHGGIGQALADLMKTLRGLPSQPSLLAYLASSMFYRDALNGLYVFGGIYAAGVLDWSIIDIGKFGIIAIAAGAVGAAIGGDLDTWFGSKPVITLWIVILTAACIALVLTSRDAVLGYAVAEGSDIPDRAFYILGGVIGAAGGALQAASRTMLVHLADKTRMTEAFGLYALVGKATSFLGPVAIAIVTQVSGSQRIGITPVIGLFLVGLVLLYWVKTGKTGAALD